VKEFNPNAHVIVFKANIKANGETNVEDYDLDAT